VLTELRMMRCNADLGFSIAAADLTARAQHAIACFVTGLLGDTAGIGVGSRQIGGYLAIRQQTGSISCTSHKDGTQDINVRRPISQ
jgi:hypothetical protein